MEMETDAGSVVSGLSGGDGGAAAPGDEDVEVEGAPGCSGARALPFAFERSRSESSADGDEEDEDEEELEDEELPAGPGARFRACGGGDELDSDEEREVTGPTMPCDTTGRGHVAPHSHNAIPHWGARDPSLPQCLATSY